MSLEQVALEIFDRAVATYQPSHVFILTSGGNDSVVPLHLIHNHRPYTAAVHVDTGIGIPETQEHLRAQCEAWGVPLKVYKATENTKADGTPDPQMYDDIVKQHGFPGPTLHTRMYNRLKERQLERLIREHKTHHRDKIMLVTGVRRAESRRRMGYVEETQERGARVWVAPVADWTDEMMASYRREHDITPNPVSAKLGISGECLCGAYAKKGELAAICAHYPEVGKRLLDLQDEVTKTLPWGWEESPPAWWQESRKGQGFLSEEMHEMLCTSCVKRHRSFAQ